MATSNTTTFNLTTTQIISSTLQLLGEIGDGETVSGEDYSKCLNFLNMMVKSWESRGIFVFTESFGAVYLTVGQQSYNLGGASASTGAAQYPTKETTLTVALATSGTAVTVTSTTGMTVSDNIGVVLDDGSIHWTTIATIPTSTTLTLTLGVTSASAIGNYVYTYTTAMGRPLTLNSVVVRRSGGTDLSLSTGTNENPIFPLSRDSYMRLPNKWVQGTVTQYYIDKQRNSTVLYVYPTAASSNDRLHFSYRRIIQDFTNPGDDADFPQEWIECLVYNLAVKVAPMYGKEEKVASQAAMGSNIRDIAQGLLNDMHSMAQEYVSFRFSPSISNT